MLNAGGLLVPTVHVLLPQPGASKSHKSARSPSTSLDRLRPQNGTAPLEIPKINQ